MYEFSGYKPPEYAMGGVYSEKSDVFSYGALLLEIVSGKRNGSFYNIELCLTLIGYVSDKLFCSSGVWTFSCSSICTCKKPVLV